MLVDEWKVNEGATKKWGTVLKSRWGETRTSRANSLNSDK